MSWRGQISRNLKELRFLYCQTSPASASARGALHLVDGYPYREFVQRNYKDLKTLNPKFPFLIRECSGVKPQLWARYDMGVERCVRLDGLTEEQITQKLQELVKAGAAV